MTGLLAVKLRRDLRATWPRIALMVVAIAVSLTVFGAVLYAWSAIGRETERAYLSTEPASATIRFGPGIDAGRMAAVTAGALARPGVLEATGRGQFTSEVAVDGEPREIPLQLFVAAPDDPMRMATFEVRPGGWPPAPGDILLSGDTLALLDVAVGDTVTIETPAGAPATLRVAGTVYDPSLSPAAQEQTGRGYLSSAALEGSTLDQLKVQVGQAEPSRDRDAVVVVAGEVGEWLQREHGLAVREIQVPEPYAHPHKGQAEALLRALLAGSGAALLLSAILVANMLAGLFAQQIPQIGIMKAIGGSSGRIGRLYLAITLVVAAAATLLALGPGILIGRAFTPNVFGFLGIETTNVSPAWWTYPVVLAAGLVLPPALALIPLVRTSRTTVRAAIDHYGLGTSPATRLLGWLGRLRGLDRRLLMALRNPIRRPARFALSVGLLAIAGTMFVAGMSTRDGMAAVGDESTGTLGWDLTMQLRDPAPAGDLAAVVAEVPGVASVEGWTVAAGAVAGPGQLPVTRTYPDQGHGRLVVTAIPAGATLFTPPPLREGRWLAPAETGAIVLNQVTLATADHDVGVGDTVELLVDGRTTRWRVAGIAEERGATSTAYVTTEGFATATGQPGSNTLRIATDRHDDRSRAAAADAVERTLARAGIEVQSVTSASRLATSTEGHLEPILVILLATALPMGVIGCIGLASTMGANVLERTREFGVMHAIGARPATVRRIVVAEGVAVALASCLLAAIPAVLATVAMGTLLGNSFMYAPLPFRISLVGVVVWTVLVVLGAMLATEAAASRAARLTVREALSYL